MVSWNSATVHVSAHVLHYGTGVFEGIRCYETEDGPAVFRLDAHLDRLLASAAAYQIRIPYSKDELADAICDTISANEFTSCYIRPLCYYGSAGLSVHPRNCPVEVTILTWPWAAYLGDDGLKRGVRVTVSSWKKFHSQMMPTTAKASGAYLNSMLAVREAIDNGFDEAILLDIDGNVSEGSGENLFIVRDGRIFTNGEKASILMGITRDAVIEIARGLGYQVIIGNLKLDDLLSADEAFFTGTAAEVTPIREVDGRRIGNGTRGPITERIQTWFFAAVTGKDRRYQDWLRLVASQTAQAAY